MRTGSSASKVMLQTWVWEPFYYNTSHTGSGNQWNSGRRNLMPHNATIILQKKKLVPLYMHYNIGDISSLAKCSRF
eukprot:scaffold336_cov372-Pavlova_lutheri.AAC.8